jgi:hypothetical protein
MTETPSTVRYDGHKMGNSRNVKPGTARRWWPNYLSGLLSLLAGLAIVNLHNTWRADWRVIITVLGWLMTIGGIKYPSSADAGQGARRLSGLSGVVSVSTTRASSNRLSAGLTAIPALLSNPCRNESGSKRKRSLRISRAPVNSVLKRLLTAVASRAHLRRIVATICAAAFLVVGIAHSVQHFSAAIPVVTVQADAGSTDDTPDSSARATGATEHCHGCTMIAVEALVESVIPPITPLALPTTRWDGPRPCPPIVETPPPRPTI